MAEVPTNPGSLAEFEAAGEFETRQAALDAYFERLHEFRLGQAALLGIHEEDLHQMRFAR